MIKILLADDNTLIRKGIKQVLAEKSDLVVAGEVENGKQVLELVRTSDWDIILLDIAMPGMGGIDTLRELKHERPEIPVLVVSMYPEGQYALRTLKAGASGYLSKERVSKELISAIRKVSDGKKYININIV